MKVVRSFDLETIMHYFWLITLYHVCNSFINGEQFGTRIYLIIKRIYEDYKFQKILQNIFKYTCNFLLLVSCCIQSIATNFYCSFRVHFLDDIVYFFYNISTYWNNKYLLMKYSNHKEIN